MNYMLNQNSGLIYMKVIMYMAISANGMIAKSDDNTNWISKEEWDSYSLIIRKAGNLIVGRRTYNILTKQPEFSEFRNVKLIVVSKNNRPKLIASTHFVVSKPKEALKLLKDSKQVIVAGGGILNKSFIKDHLVDEIYLDIEPIILGKGIRLFTEENFETKLELLNTKKISKNEIQLHYKIKK